MVQCWLKTPASALMRLGNFLVPMCEHFALKPTPDLR